MTPKNFVAIIAFLFLTSCTRYDYYRFENSEKMLVDEPYNKRTTRKNIFFKNRDIQLIGEVEERRSIPFGVTVYYYAFKDSVLLSNLQIYLISNSLSMPIDGSFVNTGLSSSIHFQHFNELPKEIRSRPSEIFYFGFTGFYKRADSIKLRLIIEYTILEKAKQETISETAEIEGLKRRKGRKQFIQI